VLFDTQEPYEGATCGGTGDSCYDDAEAMAEGTTQTPSGKELELYTNALGVTLWKEKDGNRILNACGMDVWQKKLIPNGRKHSSEDFTDIDLIDGIAMPESVFYDADAPDGNTHPATDTASDFENEDMCLYYTDSADQPGGVFPSGASAS